MDDLEAVLDAMMHLEHQDAILVERRFQCDLMLDHMIGHGVDVSRQRPMDERNPDALLDLFQSKATAANLTSILEGAEGGYVDLDRDGQLWIPSGRAFYSPGTGDTPPQSLIPARTRLANPSGCKLGGA